MTMLYSMHLTLLGQYQSLNILSSLGSITTLCCHIQHNRVTKIGITHLTHVLGKCPQNINLPISIWLYSTKISFFTFLK